MRPFLVTLSVIIAGTSASAADMKPIDPSKPTVCSITINSDNEIRQFKQALGEKNFNFVEFAQNPGDAKPEEGSLEPQWLDRACKTGVRCDILVVSGHFGGAFFGESGFDLSMEQLEKATCSATCDGLLQAPKEVFLMGCNTLAGKNVDHRTPQQYRQILIDDGMSVAQAEQVVAFRYSPLGSTFHERMRRVFRGTPRLYGFDSAADSGENIEGNLKTYLKQATAARYYTPANLKNLNTDKNTSLLKAMIGTALTQTSGAIGMKADQIPACYLGSSKIDRLSKVRWLETALAGQDSLQYIPTALEFIDSQKGKEWSPDERASFDKVANNSDLHSKVEKIVERADSAILGIQLKLLSFMEFIRWVDAADYMKRVQKLLIGDLTKPFTLERKDAICSAAYSGKFKVNFEALVIPAARWKEQPFVDTLTCVANFDAALWARAHAEYQTLPEKSPLIYSYQAFLTVSEIPEALAEGISKKVTGDLTKPLTKSQLSLVCSYRYRFRRSIGAVDPSLLTDPQSINAVGCISNGGETIAQLLPLALGQDKIGTAARNALNVIATAAKFKAPDVSTIHAIAKLAVSTADRNVNYMGTNLLAASKFIDDEVLTTLLDGLDFIYRRREWDKIGNKAAIVKILKESTARHDTICEHSSRSINHFIDAGDSGSAAGYTSLALEAGAKTCPQFDAKLISSALRGLSTDMERTALDKNRKGYDVYALIARVKEMNIKTNDYRDVGASYIYGGYGDDAKKIASMMDEEELKKQTAEAMLSQAPATKQFWTTIASRLDLQDARVDAWLDAKVRRVGGRQDDIYFATLVVQDVARAEKLVFDQLDKVKTEADLEQVTDQLGYFTENWRLYSKLRSMLEGRLKDDVKVAVVWAISSTSLNWDKMKADLEKLLTSKTVSKKVKDAIREMIAGNDPNGEGGEEYLDER